MIRPMDGRTAVDEVIGQAFTGRDVSQVTEDPTVRIAEPLPDNKFELVVFSVELTPLLNLLGGISPALHPFKDEVNVEHALNHRAVRANQNGVPPGDTDERAGQGLRLDHRWFFTLSVRYHSGISSGS